LFGISIRTVHYRLLASAHDFRTDEYDPTTGATSTSNETVTWSAIRYTGYCLLVIDSVPGSFGGASKLRISGLDEAGGLLDYVELQR